MKAHIINGSSRKQLGEMRRWIKLVCVVLHEKFGFGHDRIADFLGAVTKCSEDQEHDEAFWFHIDAVIRDELKLDFEPEDYREVDR